jgi:uncharacterized protein YndB with AHSA1/START domain
MIETQLCRFPDRFTVEYVRIYPHPIERVWRALTDAKEMSVWAMPATIDLRVGGAYAYQGEPWGTILELDPPRFIKFGKRGIDADPHAPGENYMQYELEPVPEGTRMTFTEHWKEGPDYRAWAMAKFGRPEPSEDRPGGPRNPFHPGTLGGWHGMFEGLADLLDGVAPDSRLPATRFSKVVASWTENRVRGGDFTAETAERYARQLRANERYLELIDIYRDHIRAALPPA